MMTNSAEHYEQQIASASETLRARNAGAALLTVTGGESLRARMAALVEFTQSIEDINQQQIAERSDSGELTENTEYGA